MELPQEPSFHLEPGYICCARRQVTIHTVVGSSVCVCIWDGNLKYGAMNHFIQPIVTDPNRSTPVYGNVATTELIRMMRELGSEPGNLSAQILGGAAPRCHPNASLGARNVAVAHRVLERKGITIASQDTGGFMGRKVVFDTNSGHVMTLKVHTIREDDWMLEEGPHGGIDES